MHKKILEEIRLVSFGLLSEIILTTVISLSFAEANMGTIIIVNTTAILLFTAGYIIWIKLTKRYERLFKITLEETDNPDNEDIYRRSDL